MPPKKAKTKAKSAVTTPVKKRTFVPETVKRGKEYDTTAALARPRREIAKPQEASPAPARVTKKKAAPAKAAAMKATPAAPARRGRPAKAAAPEPEPTRKHGRPAATAVEEATEEPPKKRGRPAKAATTVEAPVATAKKPGRPAKAKLEPEEAPDALDTPAHRKRGRGPKGGETTKISTADGDAANQLEDELVDVTAKSGTKRKAPAARGKGKGKAAVDELEDGEAVETAEEANTSGKQYWLMKAEQVDRIETLKSGREFNTKFTIDDLKAATEPEAWDGVRNMVARNNMRAMSQGDLAFFYASQSGKGGLVPGITGIMEIVKEAEPDQSIYNEDHYGYVEPAKRQANNQWSVVHVEFRKKLQTPVTLKELQSYSKGTGVLSEMQVLKQTRLSVTKVTEAEWNFIMDKLIRPNEEEDEDAEGGAENEDDDGSHGMRVKSSAIPPTLGPGASGMFGTELPTTDSAFPPSTLNTSQPASRAASRKPASRATSRAPSRAASRAPTPSIVQQTIETVQHGFTAAKDAANTLFPNTNTSRPTSRAGSKKPTSRGNSLAPPSRAGSVPRGRGLTPKIGATASGAEDDVSQFPHLESLVEEEPQPTSLFG